MLLLQAALCFSANGLAVLLAILLLRDAGQLVAARLGAAVFLCSIGYSLALLPEPLRLPDGLYAAAVLLNVPTLGLNLLFGRALLLDDFRMDGWAWGVFSIACCWMLLGSLGLLGFEMPWRAGISSLLVVASFAVMAHVLWIALSGFQGDLVDQRRRLRIGLVVFVITTYVVVGVIELRGMSAAAEGIAFDVSTLIICLIILLWLIETKPDRLFSTPSQPERPSAVVAPPRDIAAKGRLLAVMQQEEAWRDDALSIGSLAERVGLAEHRLRALINTELGYRNFATFLNGYRLEEAKRLLADPDQAHIPILTIAMDSGYRSIPTFNRAFRAQEGETPSSFRMKSLAKLEMPD